jgi:hypothetical protein
MRFILAFCCFLLFFSSSAQTDSTGTIRGLVHDAVSGDNLLFVTLTIPSVPVTLQSDMDGFFLFDKLKPGSYDIIAKCPGYNPDTTFNVLVRRKENTFLHIKLAHETRDDSVVIHSEPPIKDSGSIEPEQIIALRCPAGFNRRTAIIVGTTQTGLITGSLIGLHQLWYKQYPRESFHTFNDAAEWNQMDKLGHFQSSYSIAQISTGLWDLSHMNHCRATWIGGLTSFGYLTAIEIMDGYSTGWGFSVADMIANTGGAALFMSQELIWGEQKVMPKFGFSPSPYAQFRPNLLGSNFTEQLLKDYNGQTYWLSVNVASFLNDESRFPKWLNVAFGYGANGMTGGHGNPLMYNSAGNEITVERYRQYYLSLDIDLRRIPTRSRFLRVLFNTINFIKIPAPAIEVNKFGARGYVLKF